jgi:hypothetical protein
MLNKIRNIELGSEYNRKGNYKGFGNVSRIIDSSLFTISDSKDFSPALEYLEKVNWKLVNLNFRSKENMMISFKFGKYEICTIVDITNLSSIQSFEYEISKQSENPHKNISYVAKFNSPLKGEKEINEFLGVDLSPLNKLFDRYEVLDISIELKQTDHSLIQSLIYDITKEIEDLFDYVNKVFLTFLQKLVQMPKIEKTDSERYFKRSVTLVSIKSATD